MMAVSTSARLVTAEPCLLRRWRAGPPQPPQPLPPKKPTLLPTPLLGAVSSARAAVGCGKAGAARSAVSGDASSGACDVLERLGAEGVEGTCDEGTILVRDLLVSRLT